MTFVILIFVELLFGNKMFLNVYFLANFSGLLLASFERATIVNEERRNLGRESTPDFRFEFTSVRYIIDLLRSIKLASHNMWETAN